MASTGKPMIISTGMVDELKLKMPLKLREHPGALSWVSLQCVSGYPAPAAEHNLRTIPDMARRFDVVSGISDHTLSYASSLAAVALEASIIEKHVTFDRSDSGPGDSFSIEPLKKLTLCRCKGGLGNRGSGIWKKSSEIGNIKFRRSLYFCKGYARR